MRAEPLDGAKTSLIGFGRLVFPHRIDGERVTVQKDVLGGSRFIRTVLGLGYLARLWQSHIEALRRYADGFGQRGFGIALADGGSREELGESAQGAF